MEEDSIPDTAVPNYTIQIVLNNGITESSNKVIFLGTHLLVMNQVGFNEHRTSLSHPHRLFGGEGKGSEFLFDGNIQFFSLFLQERSRPGSTDLVHLKIDHDSVVDTDIF